MARMTRWRRRLAAAACVALAAFAAADAAPAQVSVRFGNSGIGGSGIGARNGYSYGYGYGSDYGYRSRYGDAARLNPYRRSGYNPYLGGGYARDSRNDWYYDTYRPRGYGYAGRRAAPDWRTYREPSLYAPDGIYSGYGFGD